MRITTLTLKNFRSHRETTLKLERFNFIRGPNGCGKTFIQMALEYLFTGRCELTDGAGRGAEALVRAGEKEFAVSATFENGETICRRRTSRSHIVEINGKRVPVDTAEALLETRFGSADVLSAVLNAGRLVELSGTEQKMLLTQVLETAQHLEGARERWKTYVTEKSRLETKINTLDRLAEFLGPSGPTMDQTRRRMGSFSEALNRHIAVFGYSCRFTLDPFEIRITLSNKEQSELSLKQLCESEKFRFSIAFQIALATVTGIRFVVIDRADVLDKARRKLLTSMLVNSDLNQSIVLATGEEPPPMDIPEGVKFVDLTRLAD